MQNVFSDDSPWNIFKISDKKLAEVKFVFNQKIKNGNFSQFCEFRGQEIFLFSFPGRAPVIFHWISEGLFNSSSIEEIFSIKI